MRRRTVDCCAINSERILNQNKKRQAPHRRFVLAIQVRRKKLKQTLTPSCLHPHMHHGPAVVQVRLCSLYSEPSFNPNPYPQYKPHEAPLLKTETSNPRNPKSPIKTRGLNCVQAKVAGLREASRVSGNHRQSPRESSRPQLGALMCAAIGSSLFSQLRGRGREEKAGEGEERGRGERKKSEGRGGL